MSGSRPGSPGLATVLLACALTACGGPEPLPGTDRPGEPLQGLDEGERGRFLLGRALFERLATPEEGLGPLFNGERCSTCHDQPTTGGGGVAVPVLKATRMEGGRCDLLRDEGGDNIQLRGTERLRAAGLGPETVPARASAAVLVTAPALYGLGLLEAVPEEALLELEDPDDRDGDGVSGRLPRLPGGEVARFGRKGDAPTVEAFVVGALAFELGFTSPAHPREEAVNGRPFPAEVDPMPDPEMSAESVRMLTDYVRLLAPPAPDSEGSPAAERALGEEVFLAVGCASCHVPELTTGRVAEAALSNRRIRPFSDLLLHDLGGGANDVCTPAAAPGEYRTPPLWGLRFRTRYLHDGSALTLEDAVAAHGGEGQRARGAFRALDERGRSALVGFLSSL